MSSCTSPGDPTATGSLSISGRIQRDGQPVRAYVRLLDARGDFVAEVPAGADGRFTFYAVQGPWILRVITGRGSQEQQIFLESDGIEVQIDLADA